MLVLVMLLVQNLLLSRNSGAVMFGSAKRPLKFAGTWYDANSKRLSEQIEGYLAQVRPEVEKANLLNDSSPKGQEKQVLAIIAPHAGYMFSGRTAAASYLAASKNKVKRVFLLGPSHYHSFHGVALSSARSFATVFGLSLIHI